MGEISNEEFIAKLSEFLIGKEIHSVKVVNGISDTPYIKDGWFHCNYDGTHTITIEVGRTQEGGD
jgi:hypothetical protein